MKGIAIAQLSAALIAACTPWLVASIALRVATPQAGAPAVQVPSMARLTAITIVAGATAVAIAAALPAPAVSMLLIDGVAFAAPARVALKVLGEIDDLTRPARHLVAAERSASLRPRKPGDYLPWPWRLAAGGTAVLGAIAFIIRASNADGGRMFVPAAFAAAALLFLWLYEVWSHQVITGPVVAGDAGGLRVIVRRIFAMELLLVVACVGAAHALIDFNWTASATLGAAIGLTAGIIGVVGCALVVASGLAGRRYEPVER